MDLKKLIETTNAYKLFIQDKKSNTLSHATLIVCDDSDMLEKYLIVFAKVRCTLYHLGGGNLVDDGI